MKNIIVLEAILSILLFQLSFSIELVSLSSGPQIRVNPVNPKAFPGWNFTINVTAVSFPSNFELFRMSLTYNTTFIDCIEAKEGGDFLFPSECFNVIPDDTVGKVSMNCWRPWERPPAGALVTLTFRCTGAPSDRSVDIDLTLHKETIHDTNGEDIEPLISNGIAVIDTKVDYEVEILWNFPLISDLSFTGERLFLIKASDVVFNLQGHSITSQEDRGTAIDVVTGKSRLNNVTIKNGSLSRGQYGVRVGNADNVDLVDMNVSDVDITGIEVRNSKNVTIDNAQVDISDGKGIHVDNSENVTMVNAEVDHCDTMGIEVLSSNNTTIMKSRVTHALAEGIYLDSNSNVTVRESEILSCNGVGVSITKSTNATVIISNNTISNNRKGIYLQDSYGNITICSNNFLNNTKHAECSDATATWNLEYPCGGNYWEGDYEKHSINDVASGKNLTSARIPGPDGIGDTRYPIENNNQDLYPLMHPYNETLRLFGYQCRIFNGARGINETKTPIFSVYSDGYVTDFQFKASSDARFGNGTAVFEVSNGTFCRVIVCKELLRGALGVSIDGNLTRSILIWDDTHLFDDFTIDQSINEAHEIVVKGEFAVRLIADITGSTDGVPDGKVNIMDISYVAKYFKWEMGPEE